jgi:quercetin dioxygenase-like cupin family protein
MSSFVKPFIIRRDGLNVVSTVFTNGKEHYLGILKEFKKDSRLKEFLKDVNGFDISWTSLNASETLVAHRHPVNTMIIMCKGSADVIGDVEGEVEEGDIIAIPQNSLHGLLSKKDAGFWSLSIVFGNKGVQYDNMTYF